MAYLEHFNRCLLSWNQGKVHMVDHAHRTSICSLVGLPHECLSSFPALPWSSMGHVVGSGQCPVSRKWLQFVTHPGWCNQGPACASVTSDFLWCSNFGSPVSQLVWLQVGRREQPALDFASLRNGSLAVLSHWDFRVCLFLRDNMTYSEYSHVWPPFPSLSQTPRWHVLYLEFLFYVIWWTFQ